MPLLVATRRRNLAQTSAKTQSSTSSGITYTIPQPVSKEPSQVRQPSRDAAAAFVNLFYSRCVHAYVLDSFARARLADASPAPHPPLPFVSRSCAGRLALRAALVAVGLVVAAAVECEAGPQAAPRGRGIGGARRSSSQGLPSGYRRTPLQSRSPCRDAAQLPRC